MVSKLIYQSREANCVLDKFQQKSSGQKNIHWVAIKIVWEFGVLYQDYL